MYDSDKLRRYFPATTVYKDPTVMAMFKSAKIESFLRDWITKRKSDRDGKIPNLDELSEYVATVIPHRNEKDKLEEEARSNGETRPFLAKINVKFHSTANYHSFEILDLGFSHAHTMIEEYVWDRIKEEIIGEAGGWGLVKLGYMPPEGNKKNGRFTLLDYKTFCPYEVSIDAFREARQHFDSEEWMDILLGAIDYNADGFVRRQLLEEEIWSAKHTMLTRLLPFIQANLNLIELAPQQTGKSYIFGKLSKYGWLAGGGSISRAKLFLDMRAGTQAAGLVTFNDFVAIDEVKSIKFTNDKEMAGILKGYMEDGRVKVGNVNVEGGAGIIFLGNINIDDMDGTRDMFRELPEVFRDTALIQRIHGFVPGKNIPALSPKMFMNGWALNTEYFTEIMHLLRAPAENMRYRALVGELVTVGSSGDETSGREQEAVMRLCIAYLKLFFPHANSDLIRTVSFRKDFNRYCLQPAKRMQETVHKQMQIINPMEFANRSMSSYLLRDE